MNSVYGSDENECGEVVSIPFTDTAEVGRVANIAKPNIINKFLNISIFPYNFNDFSKAFVQIVSSSFLNFMLFFFKIVSTILALSSLTSI